MAKDKDKQQDQQKQEQQHQAGGNLFSGVDGDKAITFQRAVFIVCNLKRIIRRPKKEPHDKSHLLAGTSARKRSGDSGEAHDGRSSSGLPDGGVAGETRHGGTGGRGLRFRDPIRRAFTLPVILCESFAGTSGQQQHRLAAQGAGRDGSDDSGDPADSGLYTLDNGGPPLAHRPATAIETPPTATSRLRFSTPAADGENEEPGEQDHGRLRRSPARRQRRRVGRAAGSDTPPTTSPLSFNALECDIDRAAAAGQLGSLSCLVTPIRRAHQTNKHQPGQPAKSARTKSGRSSGQLPAAAPAPLPANQTVFQRTPAGDCHGNIAQLQDRIGGATPRSPPICCPIWSLAMELLDTSQLQPRDPTRHSHLLGAPASAPYLLVPATTTTTDRQQQQQQQSSILPTTGGDATPHSNFQSPPDIQVDADANDAQQDEDGAREGQQRSRGKRLSSESINDQRMIGGKVSKGGGSGSPELQSHNNSTTATTDQQEDQVAARMRMKRFSSSALCLNDPPLEAVAQQARRNESGKSCTSRAQRKTTTGNGDGNHARSSSSANSAAGTPKKSIGGRAGAKTLAPTLEALDPIVQYARQRRPSVSNQGTLNVDQQALFSAVECNQLERVKSILDGGSALAGADSHESGGGGAPKVNVNSLNGDKLTCLDVAVLLRNLDMVRLLQAYGAKESSACLTREGRENQLYALYMEARRLVEDLSRSLDAIGGSAAAAPTVHPVQFHLGDASDLGGASLANNSSPDQQQAKPQQLMLATGSLLSSALLEEKQRQLAYWRRRLDLFMQMRYGFERLALPNAPELVVLQVVGEHSLGVKIVHSLQLGRESVAMLAETAPATPSGGQGRDNQGQAAGALQRRHRKPLRKLVARAQERKIICPLGVTCSHWLMDEFVAHKHQSDQFRILPSMPSNGEFSPREVSGGGGAARGPAEFATVKSARQRGAAVSANNASQRQHQEKLAIFNHLLAQQLTILSNQQRQQQQLELANSSRYKITTKRKSAALATSSQHEVGDAPPSVHPELPRPRPQHLLSAHQAESTDSAYDNLAAAAASSRQQRQQAQQLSSMLTVQATSSLQFSPSSTGLAGYAPKGGGGGGGGGLDGQTAGSGAKQQQPYRSLAYQLMSAKKRYAPQADGASPQVAPTSLTDSLPFDAQGIAANFVAAEEALAPQSPDCEVDGTGGGLAQIMSKPPTIITKYLVEWSASHTFEPLAGSMIIYNTNCYPLECQIEQLENGRVHFVRVASGNHKGFSDTRPTTPTCLAPSSWRQANVGAGAAGQAGRKRFKYDEQVFRKFTKLILLNRHILDKSQIQMLQREQQSLLSASHTGGRGRGSDLLKSGNLQNKSSLINMLLLDATLPAPSMTTGSVRRTKANNQTQTGGGNLSLANKLPVLDATASSPRGSLYPSSTSTRASVTGLGDSSGQTGYETSDSTASGEQQQQQQTSLRVRKNLKSFFQSNSAKFNKLNNQNKRGLYLATVIYCPAGAGSGGGHLSSAARCEPKESFGFDAPSWGRANATTRKLVVTNDDRLPVIEILNDLVAPSSLMADFYWLLKINGTNWIDIKRLRQQLQKSHSSSTLHLRIKLLAAIEQMQVALNLEDIGRLFYKPIVAHDGSIVVCTCRCVNNIKQVSNLSIKWASQQKIIPRHLRNISDTIAFSAQQREKQQLEIQQQQLKRQQQHQQRHHSSASTATTGGHGDGSQSATTCHQPPGLTLGQTSGSSSAHSSQDPLTATSSTPTTEHASTHAINLVATSTCGDEPTCAGLNQQQQPEIAGAPRTTDNRLLSASNAQIAMMPPELARLCETCQQALIQRRCTMASGSSSSSLASSQESWSSSQFSLTSQQVAAGGQRSCTCSRSNSANQVLAPVGAVQGQIMPTAGQQQYQQNNPTTCSLGANNNSLSSHMVATSAPASQRNSTYSARSASGSMSMMMMMMMGGGGGGGAGVNPNQSPAHFHTTSGSFSLAQSGPGGTVPSGGAAGPAAGPQSQRQTQSQQLTEAATPQKSSTFLMLASLGLYDLLLFHLSEMIEFDQASTRPLPRGLYLGFVQLQTTVESMRLLVPRRRPNMVPCARIRDNAHVSREEWELLKKFPLISSLCSAERTCPQASGCATSRSSDPAIWGSSAAVGARHHQAESVHARPNLLGLATGSGFDRDRAKSVSPGLITGAGGCAGRARLDIREARDGVRASPARTQHSSSSSALGTESRAADGQAHQHAHSDTDLAAQTNELDQRPSQSSSAGRNNESAVSESNLALAVDPKPGDTPLARGGTHASRAGRHVPSSLEQSPEMTFVRLIGDAARRLLSELKSQLPKHFDNERASKSSPSSQQQQQQHELISILNSLNDEPNNRVYHLELIELSNQVTFVLLIPAPENVCPVTSHDRSNILANNRDFMLLPLQIFETIHLATYEPDLLGKYSRLSTILETDLIVAQHEHRQAFSSHELKATKSRVSHLQDMVGIADEFWRQLRWIVDVVSFARDKSQLSQATSSGGCLKLGTIWRHFDALATSASRASITSASTIANLCCIEATCLAAAAGARQAGRPESESEPGPEEEEEEQTPRARTNSVDDKLRGGVAQVGNGSTVGGDHVRGRGKHAELKRTSSAKQASAASSRAPRLPEIQLPGSSEAARGEVVRGRQTDRNEPRRAAGASPQVSLDEDESILDVEFGAPSSGLVSGHENHDGHAQRAPHAEDEEEAIYAYHISLRDATRAAAQRKSSHPQQQQRAVSDALVDRASAGNEVSLRSAAATTGANDDQLASTCGGLNLDRRQFEKFAAMAAAAAGDSGTENAEGESSCASGRVTAYKCKVRDPASNSSLSGLVRLNEDCPQHSGAPEGEPDATQAGGPTSRPAERKTSQILKSTNPFLTDSFDL